jgi:ATP-binding protein involved in chromosome partitioning
MGKRVGMIDADIYGPSQPTLLNAHTRPEAEAKTLIPVVAPSGVRLLSVGQLVPAGQALAWRGPMASGALAQLIDGAVGRHGISDRRSAARDRGRAIVAGPESAS